MTIMVDDEMPPVKLYRMTGDGPAEFATGDLFAGRNVVLFSVPGAFTPVCSETHMPGYIELADALHEFGIDEIICTSVNDIYVMRAWEKQSGAEGKVNVYADDGSFVKALGLTVNIGRFGLGERGQRFSMLVRDGVVKQLCVEESPSVTSVSGAAHMLALLDQ